MDPVLKEDDFKAGSDEILQHFMKLDKRRKNLPPNHPHISESLNDIGLVYTEQGKFEEALKYLHDSLEMDRELWPESHPDIAMGLHNIGSVLLKQGELGKALEHFNPGLQQQLWN